MPSRRNHRRLTQSKQRVDRRRGLLEPLEARQLLAGDTVPLTDALFTDGFEAGEWAGKWVEGGQNDWFISTQRSTEGSHSAEVDGYANNAVLTLAAPIDSSSYDSASLTFDWFIENGFDAGEYLALDVSSDGGASWTPDVRRLDGNVDLENTWHNETVDLTPYSSSDLLIRFRSLVSSPSEDANVDNVRITGQKTVPLLNPTINYPDFSDSSGLTLLGSAAIGPNNELRLTPATQGENGAAWHSDKQFVTLDWETEFSFNLNENVGNLGGSDGFAFVIQNDQPTYLAGGGGTLGYQNLRNSLVVEFDTFRNSENSDPSESHISVHTNGVNANGPDETLSIGSYVTPEIMDDGNTHNVRVRNSGGVLKVYYDDFTTPVISTAVDFGQLLQLDAGRAWVGFTAATGGGWQNHDLLSWQFRPLEDTSSIVAVDDAAVLEGDSGTQQLQFNVYRLGDASQPATVDWSTSDGTATSGVDYVAASGQLEFLGGETLKSVSIAVNGDLDIEPNELMSLSLENLSSGTLADGLAFGAILTDDVEVSISDSQITEGETGTVFLDRFVSDETGSIVNGRSGIFGPDGDFYVASRDSDEVLRFDGESGAYLGVFVAAGEGPLRAPSVLAFADDGTLFVTGLMSNNVVRYDASGNFLSEYVPAGSFGLDTPRGMVFDASGNLLVTSTPAGKDPSSAPHEVLRFEGPDGAFPGSPLPAPGKSGAAFVSDTSLTLVNPFGLDFGPDGNLYVASANTGEIHRYDSVTGDFLDTFVPATSFGGANPFFIRFEGDYLYATTWTGNTLLRFDATTGALVDTIDPGNQAGLNGGAGIDFDAGGNLYVTSGLSGEVLRYGEAATAVVEVTLSSASNGPVTMQYSTADIDASEGTDYTARSGSVRFAPGETTKSILIPILDDSIEEGDETFLVNLIGVAGATVADGQAVVTIHDNEGVPRDPNALYVYSISFDSRKGGREWRAVFEIHRDSDQDGAASATDAAVANVSITVDFAGVTYVGTTDASGQFRTGWKRFVSGYDYYANAVDLTLAGYTWDPFSIVGELDDSDGDGNPDEALHL